MQKCVQCGSREGHWHKMSCSEPGGRKGLGPLARVGDPRPLVGFPREMLFECRWCDRTERVQQIEGDEFPKTWQHLGDGPPLCPECVEEWKSKPEDER